MKKSFRVLAPLFLALLVHPAPPSVGAEGIPNILLGQPWQEERPSVALRGLTIDTGTYLYGDPSPAEQAHLERINRARLDPRAEAERLLGGDLNEGITDPTLQISLAPKQPLTSNALLHAAARAHSRDMKNGDIPRFSRLTAARSSSSNTPTVLRPGATTVQRLTSRIG